jgi:hypothetical protein
MQPRLTTAFLVCRMDWDMDMQVKDYVQMLFEMRTILVAWMMILGI